MAFGFLGSRDTQAIQDLGLVGLCGASISRIEIRSDRDREFRNSGVQGGRYTVRCLQICKRFAPRVAVEPRFRVLKGDVGGCH